MAVNAELTLSPSHPLVSGSDHHVLCSGGRILDDSGHCGGGLSGSWTGDHRRRHHLLLPPIHDGGILIPLDDCSVHCLSAGHYCT